MSGDETNGKVVPPGVSSDTFERALNDFARAIGDEWVVRGGEPLAEYRDPFAFASGDANEFAPSAALRPASVEEIQAIVKIANEHKIPLWTVSRGKNLGYGGPAPRVSGSIVLDLGRMKKIEIDEELCHAVIEPGVTFFDLYEYIRERKIKLWISVPALGWGSVVGNALERGLGYTAYGDHSDKICGMEIVLANGDVIRTGMGALAGAKTWQSFKGGYGPSVDGLFMQSNFGIVTKAGIWLMPQPDFFVACDMHFERESDLEAIVDVTARLRREDIIQNIAVLSNAIRLISRRGARSQWFEGSGAVPDDVIGRELRASGLGAWNLTFGMYGQEELVDARVKITREAFARIPGAKFASKKFNVKATPTDELVASMGSESAQAGVPSLMPLGVLKYRGEDGGHLGFSPVVAPTGKEAAKLVNLVGAQCHAHGFDYYGGFSFGARHLYSVMMILYDKQSDEHRVQAKRLCETLVVEAAKLGFGEYRAHLAYMDLIGEQYAYNDFALRRFVETLKDAADPNGILSPGKQGIWPRAMRQRH